MNDENQQLPDLEIYVKGNDVESIITWLQSAFGDIQVNSQGKKGAKLTCTHQGKTVPVVIVTNAGSTGFTSVWFDGRELPWSDDMACGKAAFEALGKTVRCIESVWQNGDDPDRWFEFSTEGESVIQWV